MVARLGLLLPRFAMLGIVTLFAVAAGLAQQAPTKTEEPASGKDKADDDAKTIREQDIYIPYSKLREVFEKQGRGVFLPYEKFQELWQAARDKSAPAAEAKPPVGALISEIDSEATVAKDVFRVKARAKIEVLAEGWNEIPLRLADAAITSATIGDQPARIIGAAGQDYRLLVEKKGKAPEQIELTLEYAKAITRMPGQNSVSFQAPQAPVSRWRITIPQAGVKVNIHPLIAAPEVPSAEKKGADAADKKQPDETVVLAFVGAAPLIRVDWTPKAEGATGLDALASVQAEQQVWIHEGVLRTRTTLAYTISRAELTQLAIEVPEDQKVANVFDANVRQWSVEKVEGRQRITAQLFEPAKGSQQVVVELERFAGEKLHDTVQVPVVKALGVGRQQGVVVVAVAESLRADATSTSGLSQEDAANLPAALAKGNWAFSYRYPTASFELSFGVEKVKPRILVDSLVEAYFEPERLALDLTAIYTIERSGVFQLELDIPAKYKVRQVRGREVPGAAAAQVDTYHAEGEDETRLVVNLSRKAMGRVALVVELQKDLDAGVRDLLAQPGKSSNVPLPIPTVAPAAGVVERAVGRLVILAPESLRINPTKTDGLRNISFKEAWEGIPSARDRKPADVRPVQAFAFTQEPTALVVAAERRRPKVTVEQLLVARIDNGMVKYQATLFYDIQYSGVKSLRVDVPADIAAKVNIEPATIEKTVIDEPPDDLAENYVAWSLTGESEMRGKVQIDLTWDKKIDKLEVGGSADVAVPYVKPMSLKPVDVDLGRGQIVLTKAEALDVHAEKAEGLNAIDPQQNLIAPVAGAARAFEFYDDWKLTVKVAQYKMQEVARTSIERAVLRMVVTRADEVSVQALYRLRSAQQRLKLKLPDQAKFDAAPLRVNGRPVTPEESEGGVAVPLLNSNPDEPILLELRYTVPYSGSRLDPPKFAENPAVLKTYLCAYLPVDRNLLGSSGAWTEEFGWRLDPSLRWRPKPLVMPSGELLDEHYLLSWVREGVNLSGDAPETFQTDGTAYVYSTLRPDPAKGSLYLRTVQKDWLHVWVFGVVVIAGILLLPTAVAGRALAIGMALVLLVLGGVFCPTCSRQVLDGVLGSALFIVLVLWVVWYFARTRPLQTAGLQAAGLPPGPPPPAAPPPAPPPVNSASPPSQPPAQILGGIGGGIDLTKLPPADQPPPRDQPPTGGDKGGKSHG